MGLFGDDLTPQLNAINQNRDLATGANQFNASALIQLLQKYLSGNKTMMNNLTNKVNKKAADDATRLTSIGGDGMLDVAGNLGAYAKTMNADALANAQEAANNSNLNAFNQYTQGSMANNNQLMQTLSQLNSQEGQVRASASTPLEQLFEGLGLGAGLISNVVAPGVGGLMSLFGKKDKKQKPSFDPGYNDDTNMYTWTNP